MIDAVMSAEVEAFRLLELGLGTFYALLVVKAGCAGIGIWFGARLSRRRFCRKSH